MIKQLDSHWSNNKPKLFTEEWWIYAICRDGKVLIYCIKNVSDIDAKILVRISSLPLIWTKPCICIWQILGCLRIQLIEFHGKPCESVVQLIIFWHSTCKKIDSDVISFFNTISLLEAVHVDLNILWMIRAEAITLCT